MTQTRSTPPPVAYGSASTDVGPIIVATRGTGDWSPALEAARLLAQRDGGELRVIGVLQPLNNYAMAYGLEPPPAMFEEERRAALLRSVTEEVRRIPHAGSWPVEVAYGPPASTIAQLARERRARLLIMGIGRHAPVDRLLGDETTLRTLRHADRPVLAVGAEMAHLPRSGVVGIDFSPMSLWAAEQALGILEEGATLTLLHVRSRYDMTHSAWEAWDAVYGQRVSELFARLLQMLEPLATRAGVRLEPELRIGDAADELLAFADANDVDLIAVGSHGARLFERLLVGSVATAALRRAGCSVLACPRPPLAEEERISRSFLGTVESVDPDHWAATLDAFTRRNAGRTAALEVDDPTLGAQGQEFGLAFLGAAYDRHDRRLEIMLGDPADRTHHLTRNIPHVDSVAVRCDAEGRDLALRVEHGRGRGQTLLTFRDVPHGAPGAAR